ncbi:unnamed protein product [Ceratitis capitata]|uniref:(Mediterranean fruit fly) hypothetical protein n=1 Tax=Ceratitis capitata TaxID=7213 RepID=A0A811UGJ9_CERCA|nr:unnamed protein product [Ceratitis capitata]
MGNSNKCTEEDDLNAPAWINEDFFKRILEKSECDNMQIHNLLLSSGTAKNDHYASILFRAKLKYTLHAQPTQEKYRAFVMKTEPFVDGVKKDKMNEVPLFETEVGVYTKVLPKIEAKLREFDDQTILAPKLFHYSLQAPRCIVFEDLVVEGYTTINNRHCSLEEVKMALTKLAKMHAISYQMIHTDNNHDLANFNKTFVNTIDLADFPVLGNGIKLIKDVISDQSDLQKFLPHIESVERFLIPKVIDLLNATKNGNQSVVQVLNHGDFHVKNLMVKNDGNKLKDLMVLDYQVSIFGSPAIDLHYAFTMMYSPSMRRERMDELLYYYIINFQETLRIVEFHGLYLLFTLLYFNYALVDESIEMDKLVESETARRAYYANPKILDELRILLPRFLHLGYFE